MLRFAAPLRRVLALAWFGVLAPAITFAAFTTSGRQILRDSVPFQVRGVAYQPTPIGDNPSASAPNGDYYTAGYSALWARDLPLLRQLGANTIRVYGWSPTADHTAFLDACYNGGVDPIFVLVNRWIDPGTDWGNATAVAAIRQQFLDLDTRLANHPAVLGLVLGNEVNAKVGFDNVTLNGDNAAFWTAMNTIATAVKQQRPSRLVSLAINDRLPQIAARDTALTALDFWCVQVYRGATFGTFFSDYSAASARPLIVSEFGMDAFNQTTGQPYPDNGAAVATTVAALWTELAANAARCSGGCVFAFSDEWWKDGAATGTDAAARHDNGGLALGGLADGFANEEWWGLYAISAGATNGPNLLTPRAAAYSLGALWTTPPVITIQPLNQVAVIGGTVTFSVAATGTPAPSFQWRKDGAIINSATNAILALPNLQANDAGSYDVVVANSAGSVTSRVAYLTVNAGSDATPYAFTTLAGTGSPGSADSAGSAPRFYFPSGVTTDSVGNVYVADTANHTIRRITSAGVVTTLAGTAGSSGSVDGTGSAARFRSPHGLAVDSAGNVYVADHGNHTIRKITSAGVVTTVAGTPGVSGSTDGAGSAARFRSPYSVAVDSVGNVYVADTENYTIRKVSSAGAVTTLAGAAGSSGSADGTGSAARFLNPIGVTLDGVGSLYVADQGNQTIRKITSAGVVTTLAGAVGVSGSSDGAGSAAQFASPSSVTVDGAGNVYVADLQNSTIRKVTSAGVVTTLAGTAWSSGSTDGMGNVAKFFHPMGVTVDGVGNVYVADTGNHTIRKISGAGAVTTPAGTAGLYGSNDSTGLPVRFNYPGGATVDSAGNVYVADTGNHTIRRITSAGIVTTLAGTANLGGSIDGAGSAARFFYPGGVTADTLGNVFVADTFNHTIRKITSTGVVTTLAGSAGSGGAIDGTGSAARFADPRSVTVDSAGNVYVADSYFHTIRKITSAGAVTTLAGFAGTSGSSDGVGSAARFNNPAGVAVDSAGNVYVADSYNHIIRKITGAGVVTTLAGTVGAAGGTDGTGSAARFSYPEGVAVDSAGDVYVADTLSPLIRKITSAGVVTTLGGSPNSAALIDGTGSAARFDHPRGVAVDAAGIVFVADAFNHAIRKGVRATNPTITVQPLSQALSAGGTLTLRVTVSGTGPFTYQWKKAGADIGGATSATYTIASVATTDAGSYTVAVSNSVTSTTSNAATVTVLPAGYAAAHALVSAGYQAGGTATIYNTITYPGTPSALDWHVLLPAGWSFASTTATNTVTKPKSNPPDTEVLDWSWTEVPGSGYEFTYTLNVPAGTTGPQQIIALMILHDAGAEYQLLVKPDPLVVNKVQFHSADTRGAATGSPPDSKIDLSELLRVIELYNYRSGTVRTGQYTKAVGVVTEDGFVVGPAGAALANAFHSADTMGTATGTPPDGKLNLAELLRVIELYNYRAGTVRTGQYRVLAGTDDGFSPGP